MNSKNQRALCQQLWAENKDLALSYPGKIYQEIRQYLKNGRVELYDFAYLSNPRA